MWFSDKRKVLRGSAEYRLVVYVRCAYLFREHMVFHTTIPISLFIYGRKHTHTYAQAHTQNISSGWWACATMNEYILYSPPARFTVFTWRHAALRAAVAFHCHAYKLFIVQKCTLLRLRDDSLPEPENNIRNSWNKFFNWKLLFLGLRHVFIGFISQNNSAEKLLEWKMFYMFNFDCHKCISNLL